MTRTSTFDAVMSKPLGYAVGEIRQASEKLTDDYIRSALDYVGGQKDVRLLRNTSTGKSKGNPNLNIVSWMDFHSKMLILGGESLFIWDQEILTTLRAKLS